MDKELKELKDYLDNRKERLQTLLKEREELSKEKNEIKDKESIFYKEAEERYKEKKDEYDILVDAVKNTISTRKEEIVNKLKKDMNSIQDIQKLYNEIKKQRQIVEGAKATEKYILATIPENNNAENIETRKRVIESSRNAQYKLDDLITRVNRLRTEINFPDGSTPIEVYKSLQEKVEKVNEINFKNYETIVKDLTEDDPKKPEGKKPEEKKPGEKKPGEKKPEEKKPGEKKPGEKKPGEKKPGEKKPEEKKPGEKKPGEKKPEEKKPEEKKPGEKKPGEKNAEELEELTIFNINAENGTVTFKRGIQTNYYDIDKIYKEKKETRKAILNALKENGSNEYVRKIRLLSRKINPAVMHALIQETDGVDLIKNYIDSVQNGEKPFDEYNTDLTNPTMEEKTFEQVNKYAVRDNKNFGTNFNATPWYRLKKFFSILPRNAKFVERWIGNLPEPKQINDEEALNNFDKQKQREEKFRIFKEQRENREYEAKQTYEALLKNGAPKEEIEKARQEYLKYNTGSSGKTAEGYKEFVKQMNANNPVWDRLGSNNYPDLGYTPEQKARYARKAEEGKKGLKEWNDKKRTDR